jgi:hypothetical protein
MDLQIALTTASSAADGVTWALKKGKLERVAKRARMNPIILRDKTN